MTAEFPQSLFSDDVEVFENLLSNGKERGKKKEAHPSQTWHVTKLGKLFSSVGCAGIVHNTQVRWQHPFIDTPHTTII